MNYTSIAIIALFIAVTFIRCTNANSSKDSQVQNDAVARQVKIAELPNLLLQLQNKQLQYDFFGITSNGTDCIYFISTKNNFDLEFEVMTEEQKPFFNELRAYAEQHKWNTKDTTYGNTPKYQSISPAPVLHIYTNTDKNSTGIIGKQLMIDIFHNSESTNYDVVP